MKNNIKYLRGWLSVLIILLGLLSFSSINDSVSKDKITTEYNCKYGQCHAIAKSTKARCKHCVSNSGDRNCWQHK